MQNTFKKIIIITALATLAACGKNPEYNTPAPAQQAASPQPVVVQQQSDNSLLWAAGAGAAGYMLGKSANNNANTQPQVVHKTVVNKQIYVQQPVAKAKVPSYTPSVRTQSYRTISRRR